MMKEYVFWFHYNKPASVKANKAQITIHYRKTCYIVDNVVVNVPVRGSIQKIQPRFIIKGKCSKLDIIDNIAYINGSNR